MWTWGPTSTSSSREKRSQKASPEDEPLQSLQIKVDNLVENHVQRRKNEEIFAEELESAPSEGLRIMATDLYRFHVTLQVAVSGTRVFSDQELAELIPGRMLQ